MKDSIKSRNQEEEYIREYISENTDLDQNESEELIKNLDIKTIEAFEEAMEKVAEEYERERSNPEILREYIQGQNSREQLVSINKITNEEIEELELEKEEIKEILNNFENYQELEGVEIIKREKDSYLYDTSLWTRQYALTAVILEEGNILEAIAERTRKDCKIYPRPVQVTALKLPPYAYTDDEIYGALEKMKADQNYSDIDTVTASNGGICIYSKDHMSEKYAKSLCEEIEVERKKYQ